MRSSSVGGTKPAGCFVDSVRNVGIWTRGWRILDRVLDELRRREGNLDTAAMTKKLNAENTRRKKGNRKKESQVEREKSKRAEKNSRG